MSIFNIFSGSDSRVYRETGYEWNEVESSEETAVIPRVDDVARETIPSSPSEAFPKELERSVQKKNWAVIVGVSMGAVVLSPLILLALGLGALIGGIRHLYEVCDKDTRELKAVVNEMKTEVNRNQLRAQREVIKAFAKKAGVTGHPTGLAEKLVSDQHRGSAYERKLKSLILLIETPVKDDDKIQDKALEARAKLRELLQSPEYKARFGSKDPVVVFLQTLAMALKRGARSGDALTKVGAHIQAKFCGKTDVVADALVGVRVSELADHLQSSHELLPTIHRTSLVGQIVWNCRHPVKTYKSAIGEGLLKPFGLGPEDLNTNLDGNCEQKGVTFKRGEQRMEAINSAGFGQDREIDVAFSEMQRKLGLVHYQHSLESTYHKAEKSRLEAQQTIANHFASTMAFSTSQLDGKMAKGYGLTEDNSHFVCCYYSRLADELDLSLGGSNTLDVSHDARALPDSEDVGAHVGVMRTMQQVTEKNAAWTPLSAPCKAKVLLIAATVFNELKTLLNLMTREEAKDHLEGELQGLVARREGLSETSGEACKQDIDRAIVINVLKLVCISLLHGEKISKDLEDFITGMTFGRALMVDDRAILKDRFEIILDFLRVIGAHQEIFTTGLRAFLGPDADALHFERDRAPKPGESVLSPALVVAAVEQAAWV